MSGGSLNYMYSHIEDLADSIALRSRKPLHKAFALHLQKVAKAAHDLEWTLSGDYGEGDELEAIRAVISKQDLVASARSDLEKAITDAQEILKLLADSAGGQLCLIQPGRYQTRNGRIAIVDEFVTNVGEWRGHIEDDVPRRSDPKSTPCRWWDKDGTHKRHGWSLHSPIDSAGGKR